MKKQNYPRIGSVLEVPGESGRKMLSVAEIKEELPDIEIFDKVTGNWGIGKVSGRSNKYGQVSPIVDGIVQQRCFYYAWEVIQYCYNEELPLAHCWFLDQKEQ